MYMILDGKKTSKNILKTISQKIIEWNFERPPKLVVIMVGKNPASNAYVTMKKRRAEEIWIDCEIQNFDETISQSDLESVVKNYSQNANIDGIIVQLPLPKHCDAQKIIECIDSKKDVDGFTQTQIGNMFLSKKWLYSCTPKGIMTLLETYSIDLVWKNMTIIGRSNIVGKPLAMMAINAWATVTICNSRTKNIAEITKKSDIIVVAIGSPKFLTKNMVSNGVVIVDVGSNLVDGKFVWDVDFDSIFPIAKAITPSPGGVGPMTIATLLENTFLAFLENISHKNSVI